MLVIFAEFDLDAMYRIPNCNRSIATISIVVTSVSVNCCCLCDAVC